MTAGSSSIFMPNNFFSVSSCAELASLLNTTESRLESLVNQTCNYRSFRIPKKDGTTRSIQAPHNELKRIQSRLSEMLLYAWEPSPFSYGFLHDRCIVGNARMHLGKRWVLNIDLKDFFPSITSQQIKKALVSAPCDMKPEVADLIARIACNNNTLPQGSPSSPILSDIVASPLDDSLASLAQSRDCTYSRYADDITISTSQNLFPVEIARPIGRQIVLGAPIKDPIIRHGFKINTRKVSLSSNSHHQEVTGVVVNEKTNVRRQYISQLRSILYNCLESGVYPQALRYIKRNRHKTPAAVIERMDDIAYIEHWFSMVLKGKVEYIRMVKGNNNPTFFMMADRYNSVFGSTFNIPPKS